MQTNWSRTERASALAAVALFAICGVTSTDAAAFDRRGAAVKQAAHCWHLIGKLKIVLKCGRVLFFEVGKVLVLEEVADAAKERLSHSTQTADKEYAGIEP